METTLTVIGCVLTIALAGALGLKFGWWLGGRLLRKNGER